MNKKYLTITGKTDGFGAQLLAVMSGIAYCHKKNDRDCSGRRRI